MLLKIRFQELKQSKVVKGEDRTVVRRKGLNQSWEIMFISKR